ncbi:hypothetical protein DFP72DRAFT_824616 [Ephemerocybe angulata]|uniref:Uncharacterized protein n=1 Tax=Ephemerocybe angulata TaxID=980116 RepID=A0A8H6LY19_9AGAR|nr:hypothetical protein DFP72DRAFT_824616 [Tulosesus angulatus]
MAYELYSLEFYARLVLFILCGVADTFRVVLDINRNKLGYEDPQEMEITRDYDSVLGLCKDILVRDTKLVFTMTSKFADDLNNDLTLYTDYAGEQGRKSVPLSQTPNMAFATFNDRNSLVMIFPGLYSEERQSPSLTKAERTAVWEDGVRPSMVRLLGSRSNELPASLNSELFRAQMADGRFSFTTKVFPSWHIDALGKLIPLFLVRNGHAWGKDMLYLHMIRGVKNSSYHSADREAAKRALRHFFKQQNVSLSEALEEGKWWIDVGMELAVKKKCLAWLTTRHSYVYQTLVGVDHRNAVRITTLGSSQYARDPTSHLTGASGCRITPGPTGEGPYEVAFFQMYTTDKSLTASKEGGRHAKHLTGGTIVRRPERARTFLSNLFKLYQDASDDNCTSARVELRVPLKFALRACLDFPQEELYLSAAAFDPADWWGWRGYRVLSIDYLLNWGLQDNRFISHSDQALLLIATIPWLVNSLHATIDVGSASRELIQAIFPRAERDEVIRNDDLPYPMPVGPLSDEEVLDGVDSTVPVVDRGVYFVRYLQVGPRQEVPRFPGAVRLSEAAWTFLLGSTPGKLRTYLNSLAATTDSHPDRIHNKKRQRRVVHDPESAPALELELPALEGLQVTSTAAAANDEDDDVPETTTVEAEFFEDPTITVIAQEILRQFFVDILNVSPNGKRVTSGSSIRLSDDERNAATIETYQEKNFAKLFNASRYLIGSPEQWRAVFDKLFPPKGVGAPKFSQNYRTTAYFPAWVALGNRTSEETFNLVRDSIWKTVFKKVFWMPFAQSDRIWFSKPNSRYVEFPAQEDRVPFLNILVKSKPTFSPEPLDI